eukprot:TRINITY_DN1416_c0_g1_i2.p1 TRINITY_DN1416_c0_g1~~TRINITY_DN1416_c0_g1_i2.p1  ORF type:complete len:363 (-),score=40.58 TRINITY_DN1416_c0_g1_i2:931-2019(-)
MTIKIFLEDGELAVQADVCEPLLEKLADIKTASEKRSEKLPVQCHQEAPSSVLVVILSTFIVVLGSLEFGYAVGYSSPAQSSMVKEIGLTTSQYSTFGSLLSIGAMIGATVSGRTADYLGRKGALRVASASFIIGWLIIYTLKNPILLDIGRIFSGCGVGLTSYTVPVYIAEIAPKHLRGGLTNTNQLFITTGTLIVYLVGMIVEWRLLALIGIVPCVILLFGLFFIPESPRWLAKVGREKDFETALQSLRGKNYDISLEATEIRSCVEELERLPKASMGELFQRKYAHSIIVGVGLMVFQQLAGINAIVFYASEIFKSAGRRLRRMNTSFFGISDEVCFSPSHLWSVLLQAFLRIMQHLFL